MTLSDLARSLSCGVVGLDCALDQGRLVSLSPRPAPSRALRVRPHPNRNHVTLELLDSDGRARELASGKLKAVLALLPTLVP